MFVRGIIFGGVPRAGKTTLATKIGREFNLFRLPADPLIRAFGVHFPELGIKHEQYIPVTATRVTPFVTTYLANCLDREETGVVFDSTHLDPDILGTSGLDPRLKVVFMGYPTASVETMFNRLRAMPPEQEWTSRSDDETVRKWCAEFIALSQQHAVVCERHSIPYIDAGPDFFKAQSQAYRIAADWLKPAI